MNDLSSDARMIEAATSSSGDMEAQSMMGGNPLPAGSVGAANHYRFLSEIPVRLSVEVGSVSLKLSEIMALNEGNVIELDRQANELLDINVNGTLVAKGEVVTVDGRFGIRIAEIVSSPYGNAKMERRQ